MKKIRRYIEEHSPAKFAIVWGVVAYGLVFLGIKLPAYSIWFLGAVALLAVATFIFLLVVGQDQYSKRLGKLEDSMDSGMKGLRSSLLELWEELEKDERYSQNPKIMKLLAELKALCEDEK